MTKVTDRTIEVDGRPHLRVLPSGAERTEGVIEASDGSRAELIGSQDDEERLVLKDRDDRVLFEYVPSTSRCVVHVPTGDLVLKTDEGNIELDSAESITLRGQRGVDVETEALRAHASRADVDVEETNLRAHVIQSTVHRLLQRVDVLETTAGRVVERARETYREVEELAQLRAGRIRQVADKTFHVFGARTLLKARKDVKIKGDTIHLG
jgi:hypothetical protein